MSNIETSRLLPSERQQRIRQMILEKNVLRVRKLSNLFGVSEMTIRRDLETLEGAGHIERTFGGAVASEQAAYTSNHLERLQTQTLQKESIAQYAANMIKDGDSIALDASTTALSLAKKLIDKNITVVTNSLDTAQVLSHYQAKVIMTGGYLRQISRSFAGHLAIKTLEDLRVDCAFISAKGLLIPDGLMNADLEEANVKKAIIKSANKVIALMDSSKFGKHALGKITELSKLDLIITDTNLSADMQAQLRSHKIPFHQVEF